MIECLKNNSDVIAILLTALVGFISWLLKDFVVDPYREARDETRLNHQKKKDSLCEIYNLLLAFCFSPESTQIKEKISSFLLSSKVSSLDTTICEDLCSLFFVENKLDEKVLLNRTREIRSQIQKIIYEEDEQIRKGLGSQSFIGRLFSYLLRFLALFFFICCIPMILYGIYILYNYSLVWFIIVCVVIVLLLLFYLHSRINT